MRDNDIKAIADALIPKDPIYRDHEASVNFLVKAKAPTAMLEQKFWELAPNRLNQHELYALLKTRRLPGTCYQRYIQEFGVTATDIAELGIPDACRFLMIESLVKNGNVSCVRTLVTKQGYTVTTDQWDRLALSAARLGRTRDMLSVVHHCSRAGAKEFAEQCCELGRFKEAQQALGHFDDALTTNDLETGIARMISRGRWSEAVEAAELIPRPLSTPELEHMLQRSLEGTCLGGLRMVTTLMGREPTPVEWQCISDKFLAWEAIDRLFTEMLPHYQPRALLEDILRLVIKNGTPEYIPALLEMLGRELTAKELEAILAKYGVRRSFLSRICS